MALSLFEVTLVFSSVTIIIMLTLYSATLIHVCKGSKFQFVVNMLIMLMISAVGDALIVYANKLLFVQTNIPATAA